MTAAAPAGALIAEITRCGGIIRRLGARIRIEAPTPLPPDLVTRYRAARPELLAALATPAETAEWRARHAEGLAHWRPLYPAETAERLAWGELQDRWHQLYGARFPEERCAGCDAPINDHNAMVFSDGARVHLDDPHGLDCLIAYGRRWRGNATRALVAMGFPMPPGDDDTKPPDSPERLEK